MRKTLLAVITVFTFALLSSCQVADNIKYGTPAKDFMGYLMKKDYNKCVSLMDVSRSPNTAELKTNLDNFRTRLVKDFGEDLDFSFMGSGDGKPGISPKPGASVYLLQVSNETQLGVVEAIFDNKSGKVADVMALKIKEQIPDRTDYWIFGIACLAIPLFNLYVIRKVLRSSMTNKWLQCLIIVVVNIGAIGCVPVQGLVFNLYKLQPFLGFGYLQMGYLGSSFIAGIPLGALYVLWQLKTGDYKSTGISTK